MDTTQKFREFLNFLFEPLGIRSRTFITEYRDNLNNYFHRETEILNTCDDKTIARGLIESVEEKGFTVYGIYEILHGYTKDQLNKIIDEDPQAGDMHVNVVYLDPEKERVLL